jgi:ABC-type lipoprotein release transport system permease subunit
LILSKPFWYYRPVGKYLEIHPQLKGAHKMPNKKALDSAKLIKMIADETPSAEIMKKMGFKTSTQLKNAYMSALIAEGKVPAIKGGRGAGKSAKVKTIGVGKRGSIVISKDLVERLGVGAGDKFTIRKSKAGIALKKVE